MVVFFKTISLLAIACAFTLAGLLVPAHLRTVDEVALEAAADAAVANEAVLTASLNAARTGPAGILAEAMEAPDALRGQIEARRESRPVHALMGGPDPGFQSFIERLPRSRYEAAEPTPVVPLLLPGNDRRLLVAGLADSGNTNVQALLSIRELPGMLRLHPASHPAGAPYDAGILTLAQLIESGHVKPAWAEQIGDLANQAAVGNARAVSAIEDFVMATISLGRQLDFRSLANLAEFTATMGDWMDMGTLFRARPEQIPQLYTALHFEKASDRLFTYLSTHPETGDADLEQAILAGPGAVRLLLEEALPIHQPALVSARVLAPIADYRPTAFVSLAMTNRAAALVLKFGLILLGGLFVALALGAAWRGSSGEAKEFARSAPAVIARNIALAFVFTLTAWFVFEPDVLQSANKEVDAGPRLEFAVASAAEALQSPVKTMQELNEVTLLVLVLFFVLQLVIYCFCLIKLKEISKQTLHPTMKLRLLDNEENLFDFGLYVGLGGTVLSLILVAIGIVEASLMAAYASTLFGILFVALLKVIHLRPYRRKLILEAGRQSGDNSGSLMKDLEL